VLADTLASVLLVLAGSHVGRRLGHHGPERIGFLVNSEDGGGHVGDHVHAGGGRPHLEKRGQLRDQVRGKLRGQLWG